MGEGVRVDVWLWSVRLFRSRSQASEACRGGHVRVNGERVKPAKLVAVGDEIVVRGGPRERIVEVVTPIGRRVGAPEAAKAMIDKSPEPIPAHLLAVPRRERGTGRPTKRERREITQLRGY